MEAIADLGARTGGARALLAVDPLTFKGPLVELQWSRAVVGHAIGDRAAGRSEPRRLAIADIGLVEAAKPQEVAITYVGHSTYYIDTPGGLRIATDWNGGYRVGRMPDVVTMNRAHSTHYTLFPDQRIPHVLHGWGDDGAPAKISQRVGDVLIRKVAEGITTEPLVAALPAAHRARAVPDGRHHQDRLHQEA